MRIYTTKSEAVQSEIVEAIEAGEASADEYDLDAIADRVLGFEDGYDPGDGKTHLDRQGFYNVVDAAEFWQIVQECELSRKDAK